MIGKVIFHEVVHYVAETVEFETSAQAVAGISEREAAGWVVFDRVHDGDRVTVEFRLSR